MVARAALLAAAALLSGCAGPVASVTWVSQRASAEQPGGSAPRYLPTWAIGQAKAAGVVYAPFISVAVRQYRITPRWPGASVRFQPGAGVAGQTHHALVALSITLLNDAIGRPIFRLVPAGAPADIVVIEADLPPAGRLLGETAIRTTSWPEPGGLTIALSQTVSIRSGLGDDLFQKVALHELGHAAGLAHASDPACLMYADTREDSPGDFGFAEKASLRLLYSLPDAPLVAPAPT